MITAVFRWVCPIASAVLLLSACATTPSPSPTTTPSASAAAVAPSASASPEAAVPSQPVRVPVPFPLEATIPEIQAAMEAGDLTSVELVDFYLARIAAYEDAGPKLNAFIFVNPKAREEAAALDAERAISGPRGPLHGIGVVLKDNIGTADMPTTAGSLALEGFIPSEDAFQVRKLREAGAVIIGKTNLMEWANGYSSVSVAWWADPQPVRPESRLRAAPAAAAPWPSRRTSPRPAGGPTAAARSATRRLTTTCMRCDRRRASPPAAA